MPVQQSDHSLTQKHSIAFAIITAGGIAAILLGLALIIFAQYHERAYIFLCLGAGGFIGGIAGIVVAGPKARAALGYGAIAVGMIGIMVGLNYLTSSYGPRSSQAHGDLVIILSLIALLAGIIGSLGAQPKAGFAAFSSVLMLGVVGAAGIAALIAGTIYLTVLEYPKHAYLLLGTGAVCLTGGITCGILAQRRAKITLN